MIKIAIYLLAGLGVLVIVAEYRGVPLWDTSASLLKSMFS